MLILQGELLLAMAFVAVVVYFFFAAFLFAILKLFSERRERLVELRVSGLHTS